MGSSPRPCQCDFLQIVLIPSHLMADFVAQPNLSEQVNCDA
jgi:hypothetical protein